MSEIVNLRQARKAKARAGREAEADLNRVAHGRSKTDRKLAEARIALDARRIDGHRLADGDETKT